MLTCSSTVKEGALRVALELENTRDTAIWVAKSLPVAEGAGLRSDATAAYVRPGEGGVLVSRELIPVPEHIDVEAPERPEWTRLAPGETYRGELVVPWPLVARGPYEDVELPPASAAPRVFCGLGYVAAEGETPPKDPARQVRATAALSVERGA